MQEIEIVITPRSTNDLIVNEIVICESIFDVRLRAHYGRWHHLERRGAHGDGSVVVKGQQNSSLVRDPIEWIEPDRERQRETERLKGEDDAQLSLLNTDAIIGSEPIPRRGDY